MGRVWKLGAFAAVGAGVAYWLARRSSSPPASSATDGAGGVLEEIAVTARRVASPVLPRGIRLNNPGNIRRGRSTWQGQAPAQLDPSYVTFSEPRYGLRALAKLLKNYHASGLNTVRKIINRYAPPVENKTSAYVQHVCTILAVKADDPLDWPDDLAQLMAAIIKHENGLNPYTSAEIAEGIRLA